VLSVIYRCIIGGYKKWLWGSLYYLVISVLQEVTVGHMAYGRLHVTEHAFSRHIQINPPKLIYTIQQKVSNLAGMLDD